MSNILNFIAKRKRYLLIVLSICAVGIVLFCLFIGSRQSVKTKIDMNVVFGQIREIAELSTLACPYSNAIKYEKNTPILWGLANSHSEVIVKYSGEIKLGIDASQIEIRHRLSGIYITLPAIKILSHETRTWEIMDENRGIFSKIEGQDFYTIQDMVKEDIEGEIMSSDNPKKALDNLKQVLNDFLMSLPGIEDYTVSIN
ncbi:MAG: DUF4230 domain-containing protein [Treponema sp.]|jgi:hypothetical protein|nr:DUF4230 domain-containing protein [Treponema sp.]